SDNYAGICPEAWAAMEAANRGHVTSYGDDPWTAKAADAFRDLFETQCEVFSNGSKLLVAASDTGKLTPDAIHDLATKRQDIHYPKPRAVTITQSTET